MNKLNEYIIKNPETFESFDETMFALAVLDRGHKIAKWHHWLGYDMPGMDEEYTAFDENCLEYDDAKEQENCINEFGYDDNTDINAIGKVIPFTKEAMEEFIKTCG